MHSPAPRLSSSRDACIGLAFLSSRSAMCIRKPGHKFLDELSIPYEDEGAFVVVKVCVCACCGERGEVGGG